jgi:serine/threonine-protein kinase RsbW
VMRSRCSPQQIKIIDAREPSVVLNHKNRNEPDEIMVSIDVSSRKIFIRPLDSFVRKLLQQVKPYSDNDQFLDSMELIFNEALVNILEHAYDSDENKRVRIEIRIGMEKLEFRFEDWGKSFDLAAIPVPDLDRPEERGLGLWFMKKFSDEVHYHSEPGGKNVLRLIKHVPNMWIDQD